MEKSTRIAFMGFNPACARLARILSASPQAEFTGMVVRESPADWPSSLPLPPLFSSRRELFRAADPDLLLIAEEVGELKGIPAKCHVVHAHDGSPAARLLQALPASLAPSPPCEEDMRELAAICASINIVEAYSDPMPKLAQLLDRAMAVSGAELGVVLLPGDVLDELDVVMARGLGAKELVGRGLGTAESLCGRAFDTGVLMRAGLEEGLQESTYLGGSGIERLLAMPMRAEGRVTGVFALGRGEEEFNVHRVPILTLLADQAGLALLISRLYSELETNVVRDPASGLFNLHYFQHQLSQEVNRARRYSLNVCLLFFAVDDYDRYMERNGRYMGDFILSDIGNIVLRNTREVDTAARYGENLFAVLLPETRRLGAMRLAERIRKVIEEYPFPSREKKEVESLTACVGVSSFPANADNDQDLMEKALAALTTAKAAGPNNVRLYSDNMENESV
ncbi:MAG: sensor domain-containing diguanylate cyclase [Actinomycetota bacterium]|nr:sensor domain-containing diguanylate cyclase [Actinomycetota bacterium]